MKIFLRPITEKDSTNIVKWCNSETVKKHCVTKTPITEESYLNYYRDNIVTGKYKQFVVERIEEETGLASYPIATTYLKDLDYEKHCCELCVFISDDKEWNAEGQSIAINMILEKAFSEYGMNKVYCYVFNKYNDDVELLKSAGFFVEEVIKEEAINERGVYEDITRLAINKKEIEQ